MQQYKMIYCKTHPVVTNYPVGKLDECIAAAHRFAAYGYVVSCYAVLDGETSVEPFLQLPKREKVEDRPYTPFSLAALFEKA